MHVAMVRKTFASIGDSVSKTFERVAKGLAIRKIGGTRAERYVFKNGSEIVLIGLDRAEKLLSSEWSLIQVCQAEELTESEWEIAASRVTGRGTEYAHPQIFADCNPSNSKHWLRTRKSIKLITGSHKDNPELYDDSGELTKEGARRMKMADEMYTGVRRQRLLYGIWATAEGAVYDLFQPDVHVHVRPMSDFKQFFLAIDEGYTNPAVILCVGEDSDGRLHIFREFYKTKQLQSIVVEQALSWARELGNPLITCDEAGAGLIADLRAQGLNVVGAKGRTPESTGKHIIMDGVKAVQDRLKVQGDGKPRLTVDPACTNTINEFESYAFKKGTSGQLDKDEPEKMFDHAMDALRYLVAQRMTQTGFASAAGFVESSGGVFGETWEVDLLSPESFS
jgi:phage terminase large subunit